MADSRQPQIPAGGRDALQIDASRCLPMRFRESSCSRCAAVCPHGAVGLGEMLSINADHCTGCLLCTAECPSGALEPNGDFSFCLAQLSRVPEPVLGCTRTKESSNATLACLGGLSEEHLVILCHCLPGKLTLNLTGCRGCPNYAMIPYLQQRLDGLSRAGLAGSCGKIVLIESAQEIRYRDESVGRRSFFTSFRNSVFKSAAVVLSFAEVRIERRTAYAEKRLPIRRELLNSARKGLPLELQDRVQEHFDPRISFDDSCTSCQGCAAICPTGALQSESAELPPAFDRLLCTGCALCREFCLDGAPTISTGKGKDRGTEQTGS